MAAVTRDLNTRVQIDSPTGLEVRGPQIQELAGLHPSGGSTESPATPGFGRPPACLGSWPLLSSVPAEWLRPVSDWAPSASSPSLLLPPFTL